MNLERETGIEPATNSLEGCDSTTELLPPIPIPQTLPTRTNGGEGRTRTFEAARATDLQSAAFDRFATSPAICSCWKRDDAVFLDAFSRALTMPMELAKGFEPPTC